MAFKKPSTVSAPKPVEEFMDSQGQVPVKNTNILDSAAKAAAVGMMAFGQGMTGQPYYSNYLEQQTRQQALDLEKQKIGNEKNDPTKAYENFMAAEKFKAWQKQKAGQPLNQYEKNLLNIEEKTAKPTEFDLWKQAQNETVQSLGGSSWMGLSTDKQAQYYPKIEERFYELKKQFGIEQPSDRMIRAKNFLRKNGYVATDDTVNLFIGQNPNF